VPEARAVSSSLEQVLDVAMETVVLRRGSDGNRSGWWWRSLVNGGERVTAEGRSRELARGGKSGVGELSPYSHARDKDGRSTWDGGV
jgi:hypothetical protein